MRRANTLHNSNRLKLGLFSLNADGGIAITKVPERWQAGWSEIAEVAKMADRAGFEFILPIARWKGFGGELDVRTLCYETFTFAAALLAMTDEITIFSTVHVPVVHPVFAAKALVTVDHVSGGRAGLNIVAGWNQGEFDMFGHALAEHDRRYEQGLEWFDVMSRIFTSKERFDHSGEFYQLKDVIGKPQPLQSPWPLTMSAAASPAGRAFAMKTSDLLVTVLGVAGQGLAPVRSLKAQREAEGRPLQIITTTHVVCRETDREAEDYYRHYAVDHADTEAVDYHMNMSRQNRQLDTEQIFKERKRYAGGLSSHPLIGSPETIVQELRHLHEEGIDGVTLSFVNFKDELPFFIDRVLPLLREAGLRQ
jgi:alkanesulfonate monooxygenase SsuD/methylene tetrahydromethanopterin reductase-like flavin-dependent oxidoreductase (luciferase family)